MHPHVLRGVLLREPELHEYRVRQTAGGVAVEVVAHRSVVDRLSVGLVEALVGAGLSRPDVTVEAVAGIDRDPRSGKLRRFLPLG